MESYRLLIKTSARKELGVALGKADRQRVVRRVEALADQPRPPGWEKLSGTGARYRLRQGRYRVVYEIDDAARTVTVVKVGDRKDVYP